MLRIIILAIAAFALGWATANTFRIEKDPDFARQNLLLAECNLERDRCCDAQAGECVNSLVHNLESACTKELAQYKVECGHFRRAAFAWAKKAPSYATIIQGMKRAGNADGEICFPLDMVFQEVW